MTLLFSCSDEIGEVNESRLTTPKLLTLENGISLNIAFADNNKPVFDNKDDELSYYKFINENPNYGFYLSPNDNFYLLSSKDSVKDYVELTPSLKSIASAIFYDDENFEDRYLSVRTINCGKYNNFKNLYSSSPYKRGFNDKASSVSFKGWLTLFDDIEFEGDDGWLLTNSGSSLRHIESLKEYGFNDKTSSAIISSIGHGTDCN